MGVVCQFSKTEQKQEQLLDFSQPLNTLAALIEYAQESDGCIDPDEVLELAAAAKEAIDALLSDMATADREALQDAVLEVFSATGKPH